MNGSFQVDIASSGPGRLEKAGSFNAMFTHRIKITRLQDIDAEVRRWVMRAYDGAM